MFSQPCQPFLDVLSPGFLKHMSSCSSWLEISMSVCPWGGFSRKSQSLLSAEVSRGFARLCGFCVVSQGFRVVLKFDFELGDPCVPGAAIGGAGTLSGCTPSSTPPPPPPGPRWPQQFLFYLVYRLASVCTVLVFVLGCFGGTCSMWKFRGQGLNPLCYKGTLSVYCPWTRGFCV